MGAKCSFCARDPQTMQQSTSPESISHYKRGTTKDQTTTRKQLFLEDIESDYDSSSLENQSPSTPNFEDTHGYIQNIDDVKKKLAPIKASRLSKRTTLFNSPIFAPLSLKVDGFTPVLHGIFTDLQENLNEFKQKGWMEKKQSVPPYKWLKRFVVLEQGYLLWSDRQITIGLHGVDAQEKKRWNKCIPIKHITEVSAVTESKTQRKFRIKVNGNGIEREYLWKASTPKWRDQWVEELNQEMMKT